MQLNSTSARRCCTCTAIRGLSYITRPASCRLGGSTSLVAACAPDTGQHGFCTCCSLSINICTLSCSGSDILARSASTVSCLCPAQPCPVLPCPALPCPALPLFCPCPPVLLDLFHAVRSYACLFLDTWLALHDL